MLEKNLMGDKDNIDLDIFDQLEEALEERAGNDRRKQNLGTNDEGQDLRKGDRRKPSSESSEEV